MIANSNIILNMSTGLTGVCLTVQANRTLKFTVTDSIRKELENEMRNI